MEQQEGKGIVGQCIGYNMLRTMRSLKKIVEEDRRRRSLKNNKVLLMDSTILDKVFIDISGFVCFFETEILKSSSMRNYFQK